MKTRIFGAIVCVMVMLSCPIFCLASDADASDAFDSSAAVKVGGLQDAAAKDLFDHDGRTNLKDLVIANIGKPVGLDTEKLGGLAVLSSSFNDVTYKAGGRNTITDENACSYIQFYDITLRFNIQFKNTGASGMSLYDANNADEYSGEGVAKLKDKSGYLYLGVNETITIEGSLHIVMLMEDNGRLFSDGDGELRFKERRYTDDQRTSFDVTITLNDGRQLKDRFDYDYVMTNDHRYDLIGATEGTYHAGAWNTKTTSSSTDYVSSGTKTIDNTAYAYKYHTDHEDEGPTSRTSTDTVPAPTRTASEYHMLKILDGYDDVTLENKVKGYSGIASHGASTFVDIYNEVKNIKKKITLTIVVNDERYGKVSTNSIIVDRGSAVVTDGTKLSVGGQIVVAHPTDDGNGYRYSLKSWGIESGTVLNDDTTILVEFSRDRVETSTDYTLFYVIVALLVIVTLLFMAYVFYVKRKTDQ